MKQYIEKNNQIYYLVEGDPVLGRGSFRANHAGQLAVPHGLNVLDASRLPDVTLDSTLRTALAEGRFNSIVGTQNGYLVEIPIE